MRTVDRHYDTKILFPIWVTYHPKKKAPYQGPIFVYYPDHHITTMIQKGTQYQINWAAIMRYTMLEWVLNDHR